MCIVYEKNKFLLYSPQYVLEPKIFFVVFFLEKAHKTLPLTYKVDERLKLV